MRSQIRLSHRAISSLVIVLLVSALVLPSVSAGDDTTTVDATAAAIGPIAMVLDSADNPVFAYYEDTGEDLYVVRCGDPACNTKTSHAVDTAGSVGRSPSIALDSAGNPVVAYQHDGDSDLRVLHCNDPACAPGGDSITTPDSAGHTGNDPSLVLDNAGNPIIAYKDRSSDSVNILRCDDPNCTPAGNTITAAAPNVQSTADPSLVLDSAGNPVVAYFDASNTNLRLGLLHCDDPACAPGGDSNVVVHDRQYAGREPALALDAAGNPIIAYRSGFVLDDLVVAHCDDPNCAPGGNSIVVADDALKTTVNPSIAVNSDGNPVISYITLDSPNVLSVLYCGDPSCTAGSRSVSTPITASGRSASTAAIALDSSGLPVIGYGSSLAGERNLSLLRCDDLACGVPPVAVADTGYETYNVAPLTVPAPGLLTNDIDPDTQVLEASLASGPASGSVVVNADGSFTYTPAAGYVGPATFTYRAKDRTDASAPVQVTINVEAPVYCRGELVTIDLRKPTAGSPTNGDDVIFGTSGNDIINGLGGDDFICGEAGDDIINGGDGLDFILGGSGDDTMSGGDGNDRIRGNEGVDMIAGNNGNDFLYGGIDGDTINGNAGNDTIGGFGGADIINGGNGNDLVFGGFGPDTISGGDGRDELRGLIGDDTINGGNGDDEIYGDSGQDVLFGDAGNDAMFGGNSLDSLSGGSGDDNLSGGKAADSLDGGTGTDTCVGNKGTDTASITCENTFGVP